MPTSSPMRLFSRSGPLYLAFAVYIAATWWVVARGTAAADGAFAYALDDAYIHLATAKHWVADGVWGVSATQSTSTSSSPLWTAAIGVLWAFGAPLFWIPLWLNVASAYLLLWLANASLCDAGLPNAARMAALLVLVFAVPLPAMTVGGMEHLLHGAASVGFVYAMRRLAARAGGGGAGVGVGGTSAFAEASADGEVPPSFVIVPAALAFMLPLLRFEAVALVGACALVHARAIGWRRAAGLIGLAFAAIGVFALISVWNDWLPLPNSVLLKAEVDPPSGLRDMRYRVEKLYYQAREMPEIAVLTVMLLLLAWRSAAAGAVLRGEAAAVALTCLAQAEFGTFTWFWRYEAYLVATASVTLAAVAWQASRSAGPAGSRGLAVAAIALSLVPLSLRAYDSYGDAPVAMRNIYDQHVQAARFVRDYLPGTGPVVINDLGAMAYEGGRDVLDVIGLGSTEMARLWLDERMNQDAVVARAKEMGAVAAVIYPDVVDVVGGPPREWALVGAWTIADNVVCGDDEMMVYATSRATADSVRRAFAAFAATLPARTTVRLVTQ